MNASQSLRLLRPYLSKELRSVRRAAHVRFYAAAQHLEAPDVVADRSSEIKTRVEQLKAAGYLRYPRIQPDGRSLRCVEFNQRFGSLQNEESATDVVTVRGRIVTARMASSKLVFVDIIQDGSKVQGLLNFKELADLSLDQFKEFTRVLHRGDIISLTGVPQRTKRGELTVYATAAPQLLSPSVATVPLTLDDPETRMRHRHADMIVNRRVVDTLKLRSHVIQHLREFFLRDHFLEVQTPMLADMATGAAARPFVTAATEFPEKPLALRIAPELWLKRLIVGGMDRVFEIGSAFRNEGIDATHNPEYTSCEFYKAYSDLEDLMAMSEALVSELATRADTLIATDLTGLDRLDLSAYHGPFKRIAFVPGIEAGLGEKLPDLAAPGAREALLDIFASHNLSVPSSPTLPRLLDELASTYIEPQCDAPTFITHHPECMSPLAKSFRDAATQQVVSARAELFVGGRELANMYEEENSPFAQRRKFADQLHHRDADNEARVDASYLAALEWGMPPTGGWGCGVDRLVMLLAAAPRIADVLPFGTLRNVISLNAAPPGRDAGSES